MEENKDIRIIFNETMINLVIEMKNTVEQYQLKRANEIVLLKCLLEENDSILYDYLSSTFGGSNPYKQIIEDCNLFLSNVEQEEIRENEKPFSITPLETNEKYEVFLDEKVERIFQVAIVGFGEKLQKRAEEEGEELDEIIIDTEYMYLTFMHDIPKNALKILRNNGVNVNHDAVNEHYELMSDISCIDPADLEYDDEVDEEESYDDYKASSDGNKEKIPKGIAKFVTALSAKYKGVEECEILGRDKECEAVMQILQKRGRKNVILVGEPGVGKSAIAEKLAFCIANGKCPEALKDKVVLQLNVNAIIAGTTLRGMAEERFKKLVDYLEKNEDVILFIDEIHMVVGAGATSRDQQGDMSNALKPFLASKKAMVIGATTSEEYEKIIATDGAFQRRFQKIVVKEPKSKEVYPMLKNAIKEHEKYHGVTISEEMVQYAVLMSACFNYTTRNPDRTNDLIDVSMVIAKQNGKKEVDKQSILKKFDINFKKYHNMSEQSKLETAYHEAGHYLVWRLSKANKDTKGIAISIMPAENYMGVTVFDDISDEVTVNKDKNYFLADIASDLAGREAEKLYTNVISAGASEDLQNANKKADYMVRALGMGSKDKNVTYVDNFVHHMMSERIKNRINKEREKIINKATKIARNILNTHRELLDKLAYALLEKGILDENDLEEICAEYEKG